MSPARPSSNKSRKRKQSGGRVWLRAWPLVLGIVATPFAVRAAGVLALTGPTALRLLYPYMVLVQNEAQHFSTEQAEVLSQIVLYGQFPVYGLLWFGLSLWTVRAAGPLAVLLLHILGAAAAIWTATAP
jgi:hypothetical protein